MNTPAEKYFDRIAEILIQKRLLLNDMLALTEAQTAVIKPESLDELQKLIEEKQHIIDAIDKLDEEFGVYFERIKAAAGVEKLQDLDVSAFPAAKRFKEITKEVISLVERIKEIEKLNSAKSRELFEQLGSKIKKINQGKKISNAYKPTSSNTGSFFIDKKR